MTSKKTVARETSKKETEHSFELSLSICVFYPRIFNLEMQNFRPPHDERAPAILLMDVSY